MSATKTLLFIYEPEQVESVTQYVRENPDTLVLALDFWVEQGLKENGIKFESSHPYLPGEEEQNALFEQAQTIAREWYRIPEMAFFEHEGVRIAEALEANFDNYLQYVLYRAHVMEKILRAHTDLTSVMVPYSLQRGRASGPILSFHFNAPVAIVAHLAQKYGLSPEVLGVPTDQGIVPRPESQPFLHKMIIATVNLLAALQPRRSRKLFASEDWTHIKSFIEKMNDTELVLTDKSEFRKMSWKSLLRHRVRFLRPADVVSSAAYTVAKERVSSFRESWSSARSIVGELSYMQSHGHSLWPIIEKAFDFMVQVYPERVLVDIEGITQILQREKIDTVLLRASVSAQHHFFVTARIAHSLGIPSIEIQHAGAFLDPRSMHSRLEASYLAAFGPLICKVHAKRYDERRLRSIGAPRFDHYFSMQRPDASERGNQLRDIGLDPARPVVLVVVPKETWHMTLAPIIPSSYDVAAVFGTFAAARAALPKAQFIFKFKKGACTEYHRRRLHELFPEGGYAISDADLFSMIIISDYVASSNSTALYESMIAEKPLVQFAWSHDPYHDPIYGQIGPITRNTGELIAELKKVMDNPSYRRECLERQQRFIDTHYRFDGRAYERMTGFLNEALVAYPLTT